jgi:hypothetical protein
MLVIFLLFFLVLQKVLSLTSWGITGDGVTLSSSNLIKNLQLQEVDSDDIIDVGLIDCISSSESCALSNKVFDSDFVGCSNGNNGRLLISIFWFLDLFQCRAYHFPTK